MLLTTLRHNKFEIILAELQGISSVMIALTHTPEPTTINKKSSVILTTRSISLMVLILTFISLLAFDHGLSRFRQSIINCIKIQVIQQRKLASVEREKSIILRTALILIIKFQSNRQYYYGFYRA
jgi:hypothetical protein